MISDKASIGRLVYIAKKKGIKNVVFSPGSRNAPLIISFDNDPYFTCLNIPDERTAAFYALGMALQSGEPVIICCTSGSAALNYAPAIAEAYYQKVPLVIITADRPVEWIDQRAGQTIRQSRLYHNYIQKSYDLLEEAISDDHLWYNDRLVNEAFDTARTLNRGPVHINIPLKEPLYNEIEQLTQLPKVIHTLKAKQSLTEGEEQSLTKAFFKSQKVLVLCGQHQPDDQFRSALMQLAAYPHVAVMTESTTNVASDHLISCIDRTIDGLSDADISDMTPDILITCGYSIISKKIRYLLRKMAIADHWHIDEHDHFIDTYKALTLNVPVSLKTFADTVRKYESIHNLPASDYRDRWQSRSRLYKQRHDLFTQSVPWSDWYAVHQVLNSMPLPGVLHMANSTSVRYVQLFDSHPMINYQCNRGVSGIDGSTSTAAGYAYASDQINTLLTGDVAFFYDSNALWHPHVPPNLRILLLNNEGGNIFRVIPGPDKTRQLERHFESHHKTSARQIAAAYGVDYLEAHDYATLQSTLSALYSPDRKKATILEVFTPRLENDKVLKNYFKMIN